MNRLLAGTSLLALLAPCSAAFAADAAAGASDNSATVSEVIVTGTRQTGVKAIDSAAPIQVVGGEALKHVGQPDLIQTLSQNLPSFNAQAYGADTAALTLSAALRGLSPNDTLVLVNGKRRHTTANLSVDSGSPFTGNASADLSFIPVAAIDHVEVLQDGAAAVYGSDAVAGVVNIILKKGTAGTITLNGGQYYRGDGDTGSVSINKGFELGHRGYINLTFEERYHDFSLASTGCDLRFFNPDCSLVANLGNIPPGSAGSKYAPIDGTGIPNAHGYPYINRIYGDPQSNIYNVFYNMGYDLGGGVEFYSFGNYGHRNIAGYENYRFPSKISQTVGGVTTYPLPNGFSPKEAIKEDDYSFTFGLRGSVLGWNADLSTTYGDDHDYVSTINSGNASLYAATGATPRNFFDGVFENAEWTVNLDVTRDFNVGLAGPLTVAFGGEIRKDSFTIKQGDAASIYNEGGQSYPGFQPLDAATHKRTNYSGYIDFAAEPVAGLKIDLAGRYESYSDFGDTEIGRATVRYDFNPKIAIRGTVSTGFRAPTLAEEYYSATNVAPNFAFVQLPADSPAAQAAGFSPLKPELSHNYSAGVVLHPLDRLQVTADFYETDIHNRITNAGVLLGQSGTTSGGLPNIISQGVLDAITAHGNRLDTGITYVGINIFANAANTRTRGIELTASYASDFGDFGHVDWTLGFNYNQTTITRLAPLPAAVTNVAAGQTTLLPPNSLDALTTAAPAEKAVIGANWTKGRWNVNVREVIYGPASEHISTNATGGGPTAYNLVVGTAALTDLDIGYQITHSLRLNAGANNLFDQKPARVPIIPTGSSAFASGFRPADGNNVAGEPAQFSPYNINGGYYYFKLTLDF